MLKCSAVDGVSNKFCHGQLAENKLSYFIHLHNCISRIQSHEQNLLKALSITVVGSCFKQTVITDFCQTQSA